jgi:hypothetical protein
VTVLIAAAPSSGITGMIATTIFFFRDAPCRVRQDKVVVACARAALVLIRNVIGRK